MNTDDQLDDTAAGVAAPCFATAAARRENTLNYLDELAVEAAIANAVRQRAMNQGRTLLTAQDVALQRVMSALVEIEPLPTAKADVERLMRFEALFRGRA